MTDPGMSSEPSVVDIVKHAFDIYRANLWKFLAVFVPAGIIQAVLTIALTDSIRSTSTTITTRAVAVGDLESIFGLLIITGIVTWLVTSIATGVGVSLTADAVEKKPADIMASIRLVVPKLPSILVAQIIAGILIFLGFIAIVVPGIIVAIMFSLVIQVIVLEGVGPIESLSRSRALVSHRWLKTFALYLVLIIIFIIVDIIFSIAGIGLGGTGRSFVTDIGTSLVLPIESIALTLYYFAMKARISPTPQMGAGQMASGMGAQAGMKYCPNCGAQLASTAAFCPNCGAKMTV